MNIRKYEAFIRAVELGSLSKAAEELGYTQSGISHMMQSLESLLRNIHKFRCKMNHCFRQFIKKSEIFLVDIIECPCDQIQIFKLIRSFRKTNPFSHCYQFFSFTVRSDKLKKTVLVNLDNRHSRKAKLPDPDIGETYPFYLKPEVLFSDF